MKLKRKRRNPNIFGVAPIKENNGKSEENKDKAKTVDIDILVNVGDYF